MEEREQRARDRAQGKKMTLERLAEMKLSDSEGEQEKRFERLNKITKNRKPEEEEVEQFNVPNKALVAERIREQIRKQKKDVKKRKFKDMREQSSTMEV